MANRCVERCSHRSGECSSQPRRGVPAPPSGAVAAEARGVASRRDVAGSPAGRRARAPQGHGTGPPPAWQARPWVFVGRT